MDKESRVGFGCGPHKPWSQTLSRQQYMSTSIVSREQKGISQIPCSIFALWLVGQFAVHKTMSHNKSWRTETNVQSACRSLLRSILCFLNV